MDSQVVHVLWIANPNEITYTNHEAYSFSSFNADGRH